MPLGPKCSGLRPDLRKTAHQQRQALHSIPAKQTRCSAGKHDPKDAGGLGSRVAAAAAAAALLLGALQPLAPSSAVQAAPLSPEQAYQQQVDRRHNGVRPPSHLPSSDEAAALSLLIDRELYTPDAYAGMCKLQAYAQFVEAQGDAGVEDAPGCEDCTANRLMLEKAWQTVANEFYDPSGRFSQAAWAEQLLRVLQSHGGTLASRADTYDALHQLVASLGDRYSTFLEPSAFRRALRRPLPAERNYLAAQFVGVGIQFGDMSPEGGRLVDGPLAESPAEAAGIRKGDRVLEIDGLPLDELSLTLDELTTLLRGPAGSPVSLVVAPGSAGPAQPPRQLELERQPLPQPAVKDKPLLLPDGRVVQYARLHYFSHETTTALAALVAGAEAEGNVAGYVLDLRNDPGGVFEEAVAIASLFEDPTRPVAETVRSGNLVDVVWRPSGLPASAWPDLMAGPLTSKPLVLLVNSNTASASEVLAGALRDHGRAQLVGERTFGKGVVQFFFPMGDGSGLKLTVAKYLTPAHHDLSQEGGLRPDMFCKDYPHGVFTPGTADRCVQSALSMIMTSRPAGPLPYSPLYASTTDKL